MMFLYQFLLRPKIMLGLRYTYKSCARRNTTFTFLDQFYNVPFHYEALHFGRSSLARLGDEAAT